MKSLPTETYTVLDDLISNLYTDDVWILFLELIFTLNPLNSTKSSTDRIKTRTSRADYVLSFSFKLSEISLQHVLSMIVNFWLCIFTFQHSPSVCWPWWRLETCPRFVLVCCTWLHHTGDLASRVLPASQPMVALHKDRTRNPSLPNQRHRPRSPRFFYRRRISRIEGIPPWLVISSAEVCSTPLPLYTVWAEFSYWVSWGFARITSRPTESHVQWPHRYNPSPEFLLQLLPQLRNSVFLLWQGLTKKVAWWVRIMFSNNSNRKILFSVFCACFLFWAVQCDFKKWTYY